jgi:hypothetical protein
MNIFSRSVRNFAVSGTMYVHHGQLGVQWILEGPIMVTCSPVAGKRLRHQIQR